MVMVLLYTEIVIFPGHDGNNFDGLVQERRNSSALAMELHLSCTNPSILFWVNYAAVSSMQLLTHWGRVTHIYVGKLTIIGSDNGLSPGWCQAIIWTNANLLLIGPLGTNFSEIFVEIYTYSLKKIHLKMLSAKRRPCCLGLNVLIM